MSRETILGKSRRSLDAGANDIDRRAAVSDRLTRAPKGRTGRR